MEDKKFLAELEKGCSTKEKEWAVICKLHSEEMVALADTIKILNDDDALELFKKTLPGSASFMELTKSASSVKERALSVLQQFKSGRKVMHPVMGPNPVMHPVMHPVVSLDFESGGALKKFDFGALKDEAWGVILKCTR